MALHVKKNDMVEVITGDYRGSRGRILSVDTANEKIIVEGINRVYKHVRPSRRNPQGGRLQVEQSIDISNVLPISSKTNKPTRVRFIIDSNGKKKRVARDGSDLAK